MSDEEQDDDARRQLALAEAGIITQTDADGNPTGQATSEATGGGTAGTRRSSDGSMQRDGRLTDQQAMDRLRAASKDRPAESCCCRMCTACCAFCCCIPDLESEGDSAAFPTLLPPQLPSMTGKMCLVLDLDETLVHSTFSPIPDPDYVVPVEIDNVVHQVYVIKRPGVDEFLARVGQLYEVVVFTASLAKYASPLLDMLDEKNVIEHRLYRDACSNHQGNYVKDLALLGRPLPQTIIVDNSPASYLFHPENAIGVSTFIDDPADRELYYALPFLEILIEAPDVRSKLHTYPEFIAAAAAEA